MASTGIAVIDGIDLDGPVLTDHRAVDTSSQQEVRPRIASPKYRHVAAVHSKPRTSCLSHDSDSAPSFLGFRNLMVLVLSRSFLSLLYPFRALID